MIRKTVLVLLALVAIPAQFTQIIAADMSAPKVEVKLNHVRVAVGDVIEFRALLEAEGEVRFQFPDEKLDLSPFVILDRKMEVPEAADNTTREIFLLTLSIYKTGEYKIPSIPIKWKNKDGQEGIISTEPQLIEVQSVLSKEEEKPRDLKGALTVLPRTRYIVRTIVLAILSLIVLIGLIILLRKLIRKKKETEPDQVVIRRPAHEIAYEKIEKLKNGKYLETGNIRAYFIELTDILKEYMGSRYTFQALEHTTGEIRHDIEKLNMEHIVRTDIIAVLEEADIVKFARHLPPDDSCRNALARVENIIQKTCDSTIDTRENQEQIMRVEK